jgi:hypothetical protein
MQKLSKQIEVFGCLDAQQTKSVYGRSWRDRAWNLERAG